MKVRMIFLIFIFLSLSSISIVEIILSKNIENLSDIDNRYGVIVECANIKKDARIKKYIDGRNNCEKQNLVMDQRESKSNNLKLLPDKRHLKTEFEIKPESYKYVESGIDFSSEYIGDRELLIRETKVINTPIVNQLLWSPGMPKCSDGRVYCRSDNYDSDMYPWSFNDYYSTLFERESSKIKILAVSDSFGYGLSMHNRRDSWIGLLEDKFLNTGMDVEVSYFARGGFNYNDYFEVLSKENIELLDPDAIVISLFGNDVAGISGHVVPDFTKKDPLLTIRNTEGGAGKGIVLSEVMYLVCLQNGFGENKLVQKVKKTIPYIYSLLLSRKCDPINLEKKYGPALIKNYYPEIDENPFGEAFKASMREIIANSGGRPVVIQPLFKNLTEYKYIEQYLSYLESIGFIIGDFDYKDILEFSKKNKGKLDTSLVDKHYSRFYNNYLSEISFNSIKDIIKSSEKLSKKLYSKEIDLTKSPSILSSTPANLYYNDKLRVKYERSDNFDAALCPSIGRQSARLYLNQKKHKKDNLSVTLESSQSEIALYGIYYDETGSELLTNIEILKPGDTILYLADDKIVGLIFASPKSGCLSKIWSLPSFVAELTYR
jgi:lysophospholipase L1-like esterase